jgi:hypothetical protein
MTAAVRLGSPTVSQFVLPLPGLTLLCGPPGCGKTRVLALARERARRAGEDVRSLGADPGWKENRARGDWAGLFRAGRADAVGRMAAKIYGAAAGGCWSSMTVSDALSGSEGRGARRAAELAVYLRRLRGGGLLVADDVLDGLGDPALDAVLDAQRELGVVVLASVQSPGSARHLASATAGDPDVAVLEVLSEPSRGRLDRVALYPLEVVP